MRQQVEGDSARVTARDVGWAGLVNGQFLPSGLLHGAAWMAAWSTTYGRYEDMAAWMADLQIASRERESARRAIVARLCLSHASCRTW